MAAAKDGQAAVARHVGNPLARKLGPLPAWAWAVIGGGGLYWYRNRSSSSSSAAAGGAYPASGAPQGVNPDTGLPWNIDPNTGLPYGAGGGGGGGGGDPGGPSPSPGGGFPPGTNPGGPEVGFPAPGKPKKRKPPRTKRIKIRRKKKHHSPAHGKHRGHPPHHEAKPKRKHILARRRPRDRKEVQKGEHPAHHGARHRGRHHHAGAAQGSAPSGGAPPVMAATRAPSVAHPQGGRSHEGGQDHREQGLGRNASPPAAGHVHRRRELVHPVAPKVPRQEPKPRAAEAKHKSSRRRK